MEKIRPFEHSDTDAIIEIYKSNCPKYFDPNDLESLCDFLEKYADRNFLVAELEDQVVGCGGYYIRHDKKIVGVAWVMFKRNSLGVKNF